MDEAVRRGDFATVQEYIQGGSDDSEWKSDVSLLLVAIEKGYEDVAVALLGAQTLSWEELWAARDVASDNGMEVLVQEVVDKFLHYVRGGADCTGLSHAQMNDLFRHASRNGDWEAMRNLLKSGGCVSILSKEEQEELLFRALSVSGRFVGDMLVVQALLQNVDVNILSRTQKECFFLSACSSGDLIVFDILITNGCNMNHYHYLSSLVDHLDARTPLMAAADAGHTEIVKKLILKGAKVRMQNSYGNTALHHAAVKDHIQCRVLLAEGGASVRTKNKDCFTPLDVAQSAEFVEAIRQAASFTT